MITEGRLPLRFTSKSLASWFVKFGRPNGEGPSTVSIETETAHTEERGQLSTSGPSICSVFQNCARIGDWGMSTTVAISTVGVLSHPYKPYKYNRQHIHDEGCNRPTSLSPILDAPGNCFSQSTSLLSAVTDPSSLSSGTRSGSGPASFNSTNGSLLTTLNHSTLLGPPCRLLHCHKTGAPRPYLGGIAFESLPRPYTWSMPLKTLPMSTVLQPLLGAHTFIFGRAHCFLSSARELVNRSLILTVLLGRVFFVERAVGCFDRNRKPAEGQGPSLLWRVLNSMLGKSLKVLEIYRSFSLS